MELVNANIVPDIQSLSDLDTEKYNGDNCPEPDINISTDGDTNVFLAVPPDGELSLGDVNLNAGVDININVVEVENVYVNP